METLNNSGLTHFMNLGERTDLLAQPIDDEDPLTISGPEPFGTLDWTKMKYEVPDDIRISEVTLADMSAIERGVLIVESETEETENMHISHTPTVEELSRGEENITRSECTALHNKEISTFEVPIQSDSISGSESSEGSSLNCKKKSHNLCDICLKEFTSKGSLRLHLSRKHNIITQVFCDLCPKKFDLQRELLNHRNSQHRSLDGSFMCEKCGYNVEDYRRFVAHVKAHENDLICEECGKIFKDEDSLKDHQALVHNSQESRLRLEKKFICDICCKRFAFRCLLRDHINLHTGVKPYMCPACGRWFSQKASLKQHARTHNAVRPHKCPDCEQGFYGRGDLKKHMRKHTGERPYVCEMCGEGFSQSSHLGVHRRVHTGERPFKCDLCARAFTKKGDVIRHRRIHTGELPYLCQVCGKSFRQSTQCSNHIKNHHPDCIVPVARNPPPTSTPLLQSQLVHGP